MTDIKEHLWEENKSHMPVRNRVTEVEWLSRTSKVGATARSMVVYFENELECNTILASQLYLDGRSFAVERHVPEVRLRQCFRCGKYGHTSHACRQKHQTCFKCSESHHMTDCKSVTLKCNACGKRRVLPGAKEGKGPNEAGQRRSSPLLASQGLLKGDPKWSGTRTEQSAGIDHADGHDKQ